MLFNFCIFLISKKDNRVEENIKGKRFSKRPQMENKKGMTPPLPAKPGGQLKFFPRINKDTSKKEIVSDRFERDFHGRSPRWDSLGEGESV